MRNTPNNRNHKGTHQNSFAQSDKSLKIKNKDRETMESNQTLTRA